MGDNLFCAVPSLWIRQSLPKIPALMFKSQNDHLKSSSFLSGVLSPYNCAAKTCQLTTSLRAYGMVYLILPVGHCFLLPSHTHCLDLWLCMYALSLLSFLSQTSIHTQTLHCHGTQWSELTCANRIVAAVAPFEKSHFSSAAASDFSVEMLFPSTSMNYVELSSRGLLCPCRSKHWF